MLIDIHVHAQYTRTVFPDAGVDYPVASEVVAMLDAAGIDMAVMLSHMSPEAGWRYTPPEEVLAMSRDFPGRFIPFMNLDPRMGDNSPKSDFRPMLDYYKNAGCRGVGEYTANLPFDDPLQLNVFRQVEEFGLPLIFHVAPTVGGTYGCYDELGLPRLEKVLKECPRLKFLGHSQPFWAEIGADVTPETRNGYPKGKVTPGRVVELMRRYPNLHGDLSASSGYNAIARDLDFGLAFLEEFQDRLFFGTDICHQTQDLPQVSLMKRLREERLISPGAYEKIAWQNANVLLNLGL